ncbi:hypothetical protein BOTBODRAFT_162994 [Botryobasidium botryosum FD-172 SS1]|uniref:Uncharacterized protein n=1 Tax=Botryobasidium botryosum (strain FD-172 SS1) TaxID=930990 RepID=A0A067MI35_BOTB1|nr:hypothetical protein BOTBODRAFT_162994 [Botryobasidium botryosum FD-172 SS1]
MFLWFYVNHKDGLGWTAASKRAAEAFEGGEWMANRIRKWSRDFIADRACLPINRYGKWNISRIADEDFQQELLLHLQGIGKYVRAQDIVDYVKNEEVQARIGLTRPISLTTAQRWMKILGYRWKKTPTGQFVDGHERDDVVAYRQLVFLPVWEELLSVTRQYSSEGIECPSESSGRRTVVWCHDESIYYAHDRRKIRWVHKSENAVPYAKGEGASLMVADFVSPDYGWLRSPDGNDKARVLFKPGKAREGYFTSDEILKQAEAAMDILQLHYPGEDHVFVFDNATTHLKRASDAISARRMPRNPPKYGREWDGSDFGTGKRPKNWGIEVNVTDKDGKPVYAADGTLLKKKIKMGDGEFLDGSPQSFYFPDGHELAGVFKGMATILEERGYSTINEKGKKLRAECKGFKCAKPPPGEVARCCCRRILYNEPDFVGVESLLEAACKARGFRAIFFPKFHCELNFIEQCWGYSKRVYREFPPSSTEEDLERNVLAALEAIPIDAIRRFSNRSLRFMDAYRKGLNGKQAAWASKKYRGHRVLPERIFEELAKAKM